MVVNADSMASWFLPALVTLPGDLALAFDLREDDQDHTADLLRDGSVMAAVTAQHTAVQGCRVRALGAMRYRALASPDFVRRHLPDGSADSSGAAPAAPTLAAPTPAAPIPAAAPHPRRPPSGRRSG